MKLQKTLFSVTILTFLVIINLCSAQTYEAFTKIVGVDNQGGGVVGNVTVEIRPGKGRILVNTQPLQGIYTQDSERIAVKVAHDITGFDFSNYDVIYTIVTPKANVVEGPSAGGAMTLATISAIQGKTISPAFSMTGTIEEDHSIGRVGEILVKAKAAADSGVTVFLIPKGQGTQMQYVKKSRTPAPGWYIETIEPIPVNIIEYAKENWGMDVYEVSNIEESMKYAFGEIPSPTEKPTKEIEAIVSLPVFTSPVKDYLEFKDLAEDEISRAEINYKRAKTKLESSMLPDDVRAGLDSLLEQSKDYLDNGKKIIDRGYEYSSGNNGFKSIIYSQTIIDLVNYYSTSENLRTILLENKLNEVKGEMEKTKEDVRIKTDLAICNPNNFEWAVAARQRIIYAENRINSINLETDQPGTILFDLNVAKEWIQISKLFTNKIVSNTNSTCVLSFENQAKSIIEEAEKEVGIGESLGIEAISSAHSYLDAAKKEYLEGWYITAIYDGISAKSRATIASKYEGKEIPEIYEVFNESQFTPSNLLGTIFFEHSQYVMYTAIKDNSKTDALEALQLLQTSKETNDVYSQVRTQIISSGFIVPVEKIFSDKELTNKIVIYVLIVIVLVLFVYTIRLREKLVILEKGRKKRSKFLMIQKDILTSLEKDLKNRVKRKEITKKEYEKLKRKLKKIFMSK